MKAIQASSPLDLDRAKLRLPSLPLWSGATAAGYGLGMALSSWGVSSTLRPLGPVLGGMLNLLVYGAVIGMVLGACQFGTMRHGLAPFGRWMAVSLVGTALGFAAAALITETVNNAMDPTRNIVMGYALIAIIAAAIIGLVNSYAQWLVLRSYLPRPVLWILASMFGASLGTILSAVIMGLLNLPIFVTQPSLSTGAILGFFTGVFQGLVLWSERRRSE